MKFNKRIIYLFLTLALAFTFNVLTSKAVNADGYMSYEQMKADAKSRVSGTSKTVEVKKSSNVFKTRNYKQTDFNKLFNDNNKKRNVEGTCMEVAMMNYVEYMARTKKIKYTKVDNTNYDGSDHELMYNRIFYPLVNFAIKNKFMELIKKENSIKYYKGTYEIEEYKNSCDILQYFFIARGQKCSGNSVTGSKSCSAVRDTIKSGVPAIACVNVNNSGKHAVVVNGYYKVTVSYKENGRKRERNYYYLRINDGWSNNAPGNGSSCIRQGYTFYTMRFDYY